MKPIIKRGDKIHRLMALERAGNRCEICTGTFNLENHHVLPKSVYPQHRFNFFNSVILCTGFHGKTGCHDMVGLDPTILIKYMKPRPRFEERLLWYTENFRLGKTPTEVDYEKQLKKLKGIV